MSLTLNLSTQRSSGPLVMNLGTLFGDRTAVISGRNRVTGHALIAILVEAYAAGRTAGCRGALALAYDPNLLSDTTAQCGSAWQHGALLNQGLHEPLQDAEILTAGADSRFITAAILAGATDSAWKPITELSTGIGTSAWTEAGSLNGVSGSGWIQADSTQRSAATLWNDAGFLVGSTESRYLPQLPLLAPDVRLAFADGLSLPQRLHHPMQDGAHLDTGWMTQWNESGLAFNSLLPPYIPPKPPKPPEPPLILNLRRYRQPGPLILNLVKDKDQTAWDVAFQRVYSVLNECYLVRKSDRTPVPVTSMTISTDANSWCWSLSANLSGAEAWALVEPQAPGFMPIEVEAMINGHVWEFLLDIPSNSRQFGNSKVTLSGRSRSAWLDSPYDPLTTGTLSTDKSMNQIGEEVLGIPFDSRWPNSGFNLVWDVEDWFVPAKTFTWQNMDRVSLIKKIANSIRACVYSDPRLPIITIYPRYKVQSWLLEDEPVDVTIPEAALLNWSQQPDRKAYYNGVYISGTENGVLALVKITGTDGSQVPDQPIVDSLCCDSEGIAARQRGLVELSESAMGYSIKVSTIMTNNGVGGPSLITPNQLVKFNNTKGFVRSVSINASLSGGWNGVINVRQSIEMERRERE